MKADFTALREDKNYFKVLMLLLICGSVISLLLSLTMGFYKIPPLEVLPSLFYGDATQNTVLLRIRLPRIIAAFLIGGALSVSGSAYQGMFKNPLVSPDILGVAAGAGLGAAIAISFRLSDIYVQVFAFCTGLLIAFLSYLVSRKVRFGQTVSLILAGTMFGALCIAGTTMLKYLADTQDTLPAITFWLMGSLAKVDINGLLFSALPMVVGFAIIFLMRWRLNVLTLGDEEAQSLGVNPRKTRILAIVGATMLCASAVCLGGLIGWVGLMIPHIARGLTGPVFKKMLPVSLLLGGIFLLLMDNIARGIFTMELPLGVLTAFIGAPFFVVLLLKNKEARD